MQACIQKVLRQLAISFSCSHLEFDNFDSYNPFWNLNVTSHSRGQGRLESLVHKMSISPISMVYLNREKSPEVMSFSLSIKQFRHQDESQINQTSFLDQGEVAYTVADNWWREDNTHGSGVYMGLDPCLMYWVQWKTRKARPPRKSREESRPATGRRRKPVQPKNQKRKKTSEGSEDFQVGKQYTLLSRRWVLMPDRLIIFKYLPQYFLAG